MEGDSKERSLESASDNNVIKLFVRMNFNLGFLIPACIAVMEQENMAFSQEAKFQQASSPKLHSGNDTPCLHLLQLFEFG